MAGVLDRGAQRAYHPARLLRRSLLVERDEAGEDRLFVQRSSAMLVAPAIGVRHPFIDRVVMLANQGNEPAIMNVALLPRQRASFAQGFEDVVKIGRAA